MRFEGNANGLHTAGLDRKRLDIAQGEAKQWLALQQNSIDVINIESCFGNMAAFVTVWFRKKSL
jgi:hypothetical protein